MKKMSLLLFTVVLLSSCDKKNQNVQRVINFSEIEIKEKLIVNPNYTIEGNDKEQQMIKYKTSNQNIASVDRLGNIQGNKIGKCIVLAISESTIACFPIEVTNNQGH